MNKIIVFIFAISTLSLYSQDINSVDFSIADSNQLTSIYIDKSTGALIVWVVNFELLFFK